MGDVFACSSLRVVLGFFSTHIYPVFCARVHSVTGSFRNLSAQIHSSVTLISSSELWCSHLPSTFAPLPRSKRHTTCINKRTIYLVRAITTQHTHTHANTANTAKQIFINYLYKHAADTTMCTAGRTAIWEWSTRKPERTCGAYRRRRRRSSTPPSTHWACSTPCLV